MRRLNPCLALLAVVLVVTLVECSKTGTKSADVSNRKSLDQADLEREIYAALAITSQSDPMSDCQQYTDVYLLNYSLRTISVSIKRSNNVDKQTSVLTYTINPSTPLGEGSGSTQTSTLKIGCQFDGAKTYTYTITRADYR